MYHSLASAYLLVYTDVAGAVERSPELSYSANRGIPTTAEPVPPPLLYFGVCCWPWPSSPRRYKLTNVLSGVYLCGLVGSAGLLRWFWATMSPTSLRQKSPDFWRCMADKAAVRVWPFAALGASPPAVVVSFDTSPWLGGGWPGSSTSPSRPTGPRRDEVG